MLSHFFLVQIPPSVNMVTLVSPIIKVQKGLALYDLLSTVSSVRVRVRVISHFCASLN